MDSAPWRTGPVAALAEGTGPEPVLDYYLIRAPAGGIDGIVVEEFVRGPDHSTVGLDSAGWTAAAGRWWSSAAFSQRMRADPELRARVTPVRRDTAAAVHHRLAGAPLPAEAVLRTRFRDRQPFATAAPLRLGPAGAPDGCHERRVYRVLFAKDLPADRLADLATRWGPDGCRPAGRQRIGADRFSWQLRRVGRDIAWGLDLTVLLATADDTAVGPVLRELTTAVREQGLIPVTTERFA
ncbi:hypothetical protein Q3W71_08805 [Micromonospora sp. C28SCA-DRY-2]|uniref:hypothetical protein n=1 Tax=Micromonospora sp. C28SCA-DRY-2 TaxID=3059522 RepID=UPI0026757733|nr:hypothetical protein [Micromonospora sp. C28SCA-DRY-2]MDO3701778.1 hypothetical protein [Micromonospora sp. C28SCA-DRY-2]